LKKVWSAEVVEDGEIRRDECATCGQVFPNKQALGWHTRRTGHAKRVWTTARWKKEGLGGSEEAQNEDGEMDHRMAAMQSDMLGGTDNKVEWASTRRDECATCGEVFANPQALGWHTRRTGHVKKVWSKKRKRMPGVEHMPDTKHADDEVMENSSEENGHMQLETNMHMQHNVQNENVQMQHEKEHVQQQEQHIARLVEQQRKQAGVLLAQPQEQQTTAQHHQTEGLKIQPQYMDANDMHEEPKVQVREEDQTMDETKVEAAKCKDQQHKMPEAPSHLPESEPNWDKCKEDYKGCEGAEGTHGEGQPEQASEGEQQSNRGHQGQQQQEQSTQHDDRQCEEKSQQKDKQEDQNQEQKQEQEKQEEKHKERTEGRWEEKQEERQEGRQEEVQEDTQQETEEDREKQQNGQPKQMQPPSEPQHNDQQGLKDQQEHNERQEHNEQQGQKDQQRFGAYGNIAHYLQPTPFVISV